jgi:hypothetical protein
MTDITYRQLIEVKITRKLYKPNVTLWHRVLLKNINASLYQERDNHVTSEVWAVSY